MTLEIVPCLLWHANFLGPRLRTADAAECAAMGYATPAEAVRFAVTCSTEAFACVEDGFPIAAWGFEASPVLTADTAQMWCCTTPAVELHKKQILKQSRAFVSHVQQRHGVLEAYVMQSYRSSVQWLSWLGFEMIAGVTFNETSFYLARKTRIV